MSWKNEEKCPNLRELGVQLNQSAYSSPLGRPAKHSIKERNAIKKICLRCSYSYCIYEREN